MPQRGDQIIVMLEHDLKEMAANKARPTRRSVSTFVRNLILRDLLDSNEITEEIYRILLR